jgi:hypothetical protein
MLFTNADFKRPTKRIEHKFQFLKVTALIALLQSHNSVFVQNTSTVQL